MIGINLRQVKRSEISIARLTQYWEQQGVTIIRSRPSREGFLIKFSTDTGWSAIVDLYEWFAQVMPKQAGLSREAFSDSQIESLFLECAKPHAKLPKELTYKYITKHYRINQKTSERESVEECNALLTQEGVLWLTDLSEKQTDIEFSPPHRRLTHLLMPIQIEIGSSEISVGLLKRVSIGDTFLINNIEQKITLNGKKIGHFERNGGMIMIEEDMENEKSYMQTELSASENPAEITTILSKRSQLPVRITFALQQSVITLGELEKLYEGQIFNCEPDAENNIIIQGHGISLARGQLVWVEDRLGVEIKEICHEAENGK